MLDKKNNDVAALLQQVQSMVEILDNIGSYVFTKDLEGKYVYVNSDVADLFNTSVENIIGKDDKHFFVHDTYEQLRQKDLNVIRTKATIKSEEVNVLKQTGVRNIFKTTKKPLFNDAGEVIGLFGISTDITKKKLLQAENRDQKHLLDVILNNVDAYIYMKDSNRHFKYVNNKVATLFGLPPEEIIGKRDIDVIPKDYADHFWNTDKLVFEKNDKVVINEEVTDKDDVVHHYLSIKVPCEVTNENKTLIGFSTDVTELYQLKEKFKQLANTDELTGLYNRRYFFDNAKREFNRAKRHDQMLAVIAIDVDHFKKINDKYGHPIGDIALVNIAKLITPTIRAEDILARIGGEEFSILLPCTSQQQCQHVAERLRVLLDSTPILATKDIQLSVKISLGVSIIKPSDTCFQDLYTRSDLALYEAKSMGRNKVFMID